ncbi:MAG: M15 family metallopeptidase [Defluviitaleaceae bacterium]|nr:M15 family metallopeptidase [Defluviitaleaceae bacterium]
MSKQKRSIVTMGIKLTAALAVMLLLFASCTPQTEQVSQVAQSPQTEQAVQTEQTTQSEQAAQTEQTTQSEQSEQTEQTGQTTQTGQTEQTTQTTQPEQSQQTTPTPLPEGFVYVTDAVPDAILEIRYFSTYNFVGARVDDYLAPRAIITEPAAEALKQVNAELQAQGYAIKVFDTYRPQGAVDHFVRWAADPDDVATKEYFYPDIAKDRIIPDGYIAERSGHSRGSTIDLTLVELLTGKEVDMGTPFDFFGLASHHETDLITEEQASNRLILKNAMVDAGFRIYDEEWWHYTLDDEPYPDTFFDFPVR